MARLSRVRGLTVIAAGALTAAVAGVVSVASGRTLGAKRVAPVAKVSAAAPARVTMPPLASAGQLGLGAPGSAPQAAPVPQPQPQVQASQSAPAVSGGS